MDIKTFVGIWEILGCKYHNEKEFDSPDLQGVLFKLEDNNDVVWTVPYDLTRIPWFQCEMYEITRINDLSYIIRFGTYRGHLIEFRCDDALPNEEIILTLNEWCAFYCKRLREVPKERTIKTTFTLLPALQEEFFVDLKLKGCDNVEFNCHSMIVKLLASEIPWNSQPFSEQPAFIANTILHYLYTESLPDTLNEYELYELIQYAKQFSCFDNFVIKCYTYERKLKLSQKLRNLMADMQLYINYIVDRFRNLEKHRKTATPKELSEIAKQSIKDVLIIGTKFALFCKLYASQKHDLTKHDENQIIRLTKFHLPIFMNKVRKLFELLSTGLCSLTAEQIDELARHLVPEYEKILHRGSKVIRTIAKAIKEVLQLLSPQSNDSRWVAPFSDFLELSFKNIFKARELQVMVELYDHITCGFELILRKSEYFRGKSEEFKVKSVVYTLNEIVDELPIFVIRLHTVLEVVEEKLDLNDYRLFFKVLTSQVAAIMEKIVEHRCSLDSFFNNFIAAVDREEFTNCLISLGLLNQDIKSEPVKNHDHPCMVELHETLLQESFNLLETVCQPPLIENSLLSKKCLELFKNKIGIDMEFEVIPNSGLEDSVEGGNNDSESSESCTFYAHRIIMAARCYWFRRALLCDMKEAIDRKIIIHDTNPSAFQIFLEFLYSSQLDYSNLMLPQLVELLLLSDRYEVDSLKQVCEYGLELHMDEDSVLYLLNVADQCNASVLKNNCIYYVLKNDEITHSDVFSNLPIALQNEVFDKMWSYPSQNISNKQCNLRKDFPNYQKFDENKTCQDGLSHSNF